MIQACLRALMAALPHHPERSVIIVPDKASRTES
jgi:hypothetical protein